MGGLGPDLLNQELIEKHKKRQEMKNYAKQILQSNREALKKSTKSVDSTRRVKPKIPSARERV